MTLFSDGTLVQHGPPDRVVQLAWCADFIASISNRSIYFEQTPNPIQPRKSTVRSLTPNLTSSYALNVAYVSTLKNCTTTPPNGTRTSKFLKPKMTNFS